MQTEPPEADPPKRNRRRFQISLVRRRIVLCGFLTVLSSGIALARGDNARDVFQPAQAPRPLVLRSNDFRRYFEEFNRNDRELYSEYIPNAAAWDFLKNNIPLLDCPDKELEQIYYFRWWTYRKHIKQTPDGFIVTEFLPAVGWAGKYNSISCAAGHHFYEGRWLNDSRYLDDYADFWFRNGGSVRAYSCWAADSLWSYFLVSGDDHRIRELLPVLIANYEAWEREHRDANGLFWQIDDRDGMEDSISGGVCPKGEGYRPTINSYLYGDARAIANIAERLGKEEIAERFRAKAAQIKRLVQERLWQPQSQFFEVLPRDQKTRLSGVRELHGYTPWYFDLPDADKSVAWKQLVDSKGFQAPYGPTTAEQRDPKFEISYRGHECQWNGPSWPFATSVTLTALANLLNDYQQDVVTRADYFDLLKVYTHSQYRQREDGTVVPWIDESLNPFTGDWISRTRLKQWKNGTWDPGKGGVERGKDYNHSTFCDLVISGLIGLRPRADEIVDINPLLPDGAWDYFCLDQIRYHGHWLTILYDKIGEHYGRGKGLHVFSDGIEIASATQLQHVTIRLPAGGDPETAGGWVKYEHNPVMGGKYGTCFDISVLHEGGVYRMWLSWRPKHSVALVESKDGIHWSEPPTIVLSPRKETGWEDDVNRPVVVKRGDGYHMWYTGQANGHSSIGYAISTDGKTWRRMSDKPVLSPDKPWEKVAVMCPHVMWDESAKLFRMWYSGGGQYEPNAIGYATSRDGLNWTKSDSNPIFSADPKIAWEQNRVTGCQVIRRPDDYLMFYIGFRDIDHAQIGVARSKDGITNWQRHPDNPIVRRGNDRWDHDACYKPFAVLDGHRWLLWYNGRHGSLEQIGVVFHEGEDLGFDNSPR
jgi:predicted GH43/DUF377 family glycosyl hydrolase